MSVRQKHLWTTIGAVVVLILGVCLVWSEAPAFAAAPPPVNAQVTYHSYQAPEGWVAFRVANQPGGITLESAEATIVNRTTGASLYGPGLSNTPFRPGPTSDTLNDKLSPGQGAYLRYKLNGNPTGIPCRATIKLYAGNNRSGASSTKTIDFQLPSGPPPPVVTATHAPPPVNAQVTYHSYQAPDGWVAFRVANQPGGITLESAEATIVNRTTGASLYGPGLSNTPFRPGPTSDTLNDKLSPGQGAYLRYKLNGNPTGIPCRATIKLYAGNNRSGASSTKTIDFQLPSGPPPPVVTATHAPPPVNAQVTYHSYQAPDGWVVFLVANQPGGITLESASATIVNRTTGASLYGPAYSNTPFHPGPVSDTLNDKLSPGQGAYLRYKLNGNPTGIPCRATIKLYAANNQGGASSTKTVDFQLPSGPPPPVVTATHAPPPVNAQVTYHGYDVTGGWVIFLVANQPHGITLESASAHIQNRTTGANLYGPAYSNTPFHPGPVSDTLNDTLPPGQGAYLRYKLTGSPTGSPCRATIKLYAANNQGGASSTKTVDFQLPSGPPPPVVTATHAPPPVNAQVTYHGYDVTGGWVIFLVANQPGGITLESASATIVNRTTGASLYGPAYSNTPFHPGPVSDTLNDKLSPGQGAYLRYKLNGNPTGIPCRATIKLYAANNQGGASSTKTVDFQLPSGPPPPPPINAQLTYHSYDAASGWVTFRVANQPGGVTLESASATIQNLASGANVYGPGTSNSPFRSSATSDVLVDKLSPGVVGYMRYKLSGNPTGIPCRATIVLYAGNNQSGASSTKTVEFELPAAPPPPPVNAQVTYHGYDVTGGWVIFLVANQPGGITLESASAHIQNRTTGASLYGPAYSNTPFHPGPVSDTLNDTLPPGQGAYLRYKLTGSPTGIPCRATIVLYAANNQGGVSSTKTIDFQLPSGPPPPPPVNAQLTYHSYDAASGWVTFRIVNQPGGVTLESASATIQNLASGANVYGPGTSNSPFRSSATSDVLVDQLSPGVVGYMRYKLSGNPTGIPCRATIVLYAGNNQSGASSTKTVEFQLPAAPSANANITYHSYDAATGWVTFRIVNGAGAPPVECVEASIKNQTTNAPYYGPAYSNTPFRPTPTSDALESALAPGATKYLRYKLNGNPTGVPCTASFELYSANDRAGTHVNRGVNFNLPSGALGINASLTAHSYDKTTGWVTFSIVNAATGAPLESAEATIVNRTTGAVYYGPNMYSDTPFRSGPTSNTLEDSVATGESKYMRYKLTGNPTSVPCRATIVLYSGNGKTGVSATKVVDFNLAE